MRIVSFTEARNSLKAVLDSVLTDADTAVITRRDAEADKQIDPRSATLAFYRHRKARSIERKSGRLLVQAYR